jgi:hypothetical protein
MEVNTIVDFLKTIEHKGMSSPCKEDILRKLENDGSPFNTLQGIEDGAVRSVMLACEFSP